MTRRDEYAEIWKTIPVQSTTIDIPEGATEEGAAQGRTLPDTLTAEQANAILADGTPNS